MIFAGERTRFERTETEPTWDKGAASRRSGLSVVEAPDSDPDPDVERSTGAGGRVSELADGKGMHSDPTLRPVSGESMACAACSRDAALCTRLPRGAGMDCVEAEGVVVANKLVGREDRVE